MMRCRHTPAPARPRASSSTWLESGCAATSHQPEHAWVCCTVGEQIAALRRIAGDKVVARIRRAPNPFVARMVAGWPSRFDPRRALALGFRAERSFDDIIRVHIEDDLDGKIA
jgi:hypothetical protein